MSVVDVLKGDPRLTPARPDLAAKALEGEVQAARFVEGTPAQVQASVAPLRRAPRHDASLDTQLLFGEMVSVYEDKDGWSWVQAEQDGYVGYVPSDALTPERRPPSATVRTLRSFVFPKPDLKTPPLGALSLTARVSVTNGSGPFSAIARANTPLWGYVFTDHLTVLDHPASDFVAEAERFLGVPYLWGGRESLGLDCSGLVQTALARAGMAAPRDADMQEKTVGVPLDIDPSNPEGLRRGDLVFWKGHVGIMVDEARLLHANATYMAVTINDLTAFASQVADDAGPITSVRRPTLKE